MDVKEKDMTVSFKCSEAFHGRLRVAAHKEMMSKSEFMRSAIEDRIKKL